MSVISICDETISGGRTSAVELEWGSGTISVRELIASRVEEEVRRHNARWVEPEGEVFRGLVQPSDSEKILHGYRLHKRRAISPDSQIERALEAFGRNGFFILVNERQVESLDEEIEIALTTQVSFVKLLPMVGG